MSSIYKYHEKVQRDGPSDTDDSSSSSDSDVEEVRKPALVKRIREKILLLSSRGVTYRHRHLLSDLFAMLPHSKKDNKLDNRNNLKLLNELAELYNCNNVLFFEARKKLDLYLWLAKAPNGPTVKFYVQNIHTMDELNMIGNCLKGSRPVLSFDKMFQSQAHWRLMKQMLQQLFAVPKGTRRAKPFIDRVVSFTIADGKIFFRHFQIVEKEPEDKPKKKGTPNELTLREIGPRFVLTPIVVLEGSFGGPVIYKNENFVSANTVRAALRKQKMKGAFNREANKTKYMMRKSMDKIPQDPLSNKNTIFS